VGVEVDRRTVRRHVLVGSFRARRLWIFLMQLGMVGSLLAAYNVDFPRRTRRQCQPVILVKLLSAPRRH
jgi:hypothetical protein